VYRTEGEMDMAYILKTVEAAVGKVPLALGVRMTSLDYELSDVCKLYNKGRCHYQVCKFRHSCRACMGTIQQQQDRSVLPRLDGEVSQTKDPYTKSSTQSEGKRSGSSLLAGEQKQDNMHYHAQNMPAPYILGLLL